MNTINALYEWGTLQLGTGPTAAFETRLLLAHALQCTLTFLYQNPDNTVAKEVVEEYQTLIIRRTRHEPLAYILGYKEFYSLRFEVSYDTLIPRIQSELLVKTALAHLSDHQEILDLGTGCGAIGCTIAYFKPNCFITATDISPKALHIAKKNAEKFNLKNIEFIESNWFEKIGNRQFDAIISNPPYLRSHDLTTLFGDTLFEPPIALSVSLTGYEVFQWIAKECPAYLKPEGWLALEHGFDQTEKIHAFLDTHFTRINTLYDSAGNARVTTSYKKMSPV